MANARRRKTKMGMGAVSATTSGIRAKPVDTAIDRRDTELDLHVSRPEEETGKRRRFTQDIAAAFVERHSTVPEMRASAPPESGQVRRSKTPRPALRVDEVQVSAKKITMRGPVELKPRIVNAERISRAPLDARDAFLLQLVDGTLSTSDLVDASGFSEADVDAILARLARLGIVAL